MNVVSAFLQIFASIWDGFFGLTSPFFNLTFKQIAIGIFVVGLSIGILWQLIGIGGSLFHDTVSIGRSSVNRSRSARYRRSRYAQAERHHQERLNAFKSRKPRKP